MRKTFLNLKPIKRWDCCQYRMYGDKMKTSWVNVACYVGPISVESLQMGCCGGSTLVFEFACATWAVKLFDTDERKPTGQCQVSREWIWPHEKIPHNMSTTYCGMSLVLSPPTLQSDLCACVLLKLLLSWLCSKERTIDCLSKIAQGKYTAAVISIFQCHLSKMVQKLEDPLAFLRTVLDFTVSHVDMFDLGSFGLSQVKNDSVWLLQFVNPRYVRYVHYSKVFWLAALPSVWIEETWPSNSGQSQYCEFFSSDSKKMISKKMSSMLPLWTLDRFNFKKTSGRKVSSLLGRAWSFKVWNFLSILILYPAKGSGTHFQELPRWPDSEVEHANLIQPQQAAFVRPWSSLCCFVSSSCKSTKFVFSVHQSDWKCPKVLKSARRSRSSRRKLCDP